MSNELYFIQILAGAFEKKDIPAALKESFQKIQTLGKLPEYQKGYEQFNRFIAEVVVAMKRSSHDAENFSKEILKDAAIQIATGILHEDHIDTTTLISLIQQEPDMQKMFKALCCELAEADTKPASLSIIIEKDNDKIFSILSEEHLPERKTINILPGHYVIRLTTGRVLWEGNLERHDLFLTDALSESDLQMAADTEDTPSQATQKLKLLDGEMLIQIFPGIACGILEIQGKGSTRV